MDALPNTENHPAAELHEGPLPCQALGFGEPGARWNAPAALSPLGTGHRVPPRPEITVAAAKDAGRLSGNAESPRQSVGEQSSPECVSLCRETKTCPEA